MTKLTVKSSAFENDGLIPRKHTCDGEDVSPPLSWEAGPARTVGYALIVEDPDAPGGKFVHWLAWNIMDTALAENVPKGEQERLRQGRNSFKRVGYGGPCPPSGKHHYVFKVYALEKQLDIEPGSDVEALRRAIEGFVLGEGEIVGLYARQ